MDAEKSLKLLRVINGVLKNIGVKSITELDSSLNLRDDLEIDSISYAELVVIIEEEFQVNINQSDKAETISDIVQRLNQEKVD